jgi:hypothetical protein
MSNVFMYLKYILEIGTTMQQFSRYCYYSLSFIQLFSHPLSAISFLIQATYDHSIIPMILLIIPQQTANQAVLSCKLPPAYLYFIFYRFHSYFATKKTISEYHTVRAIIITFEIISIVKIK